MSQKIKQLEGFSGTMHNEDEGVNITAGYNAKMPEQETEGCVEGVPSTSGYDLDTEPIQKSTTSPALEELVSIYLTLLA